MWYLQELMGTIGVKRFQQQTRTTPFQTVHAQAHNAQSVAAHCRCTITTAIAVYPAKTALRRLPPNASLQIICIT